MLESVKTKTQKLRSQVKVLGLIGALFLTSIYPVAPALADDEGDQFNEYEIRVIRPKYFTKVGRYELGAQFVLVMTDTFVYTLMASGLLTYHFSETLALEASVAVGQSLDRAEKGILIDEFKIKTEVFRTLYSAEAAVLYTPIYGKLQLPEGKLVYFDTFLAFGAGMTGVEWRYSDYCQNAETTKSTTGESTSGTTEEVPANTVKTYPNLVYGIGQRVYYSRSSAIKWDLRGHSIIYNKGDSSCSASGGESGSKINTNITIQLGASKFF